MTVPKRRIDRGSCITIASSGLFGSGEPKSGTLLELWLAGQPDAVPLLEEVISLARERSACETAFRMSMRGGLVGAKQMPRADVRPARADALAPAPKQGHSSCTASESPMTVNPATLKESALVWA